MPDVKVATQRRLGSGLDSGLAMIAAVIAARLIACPPATAAATVAAPEVTSTGRGASRYPNVDITANPGTFWPAIVTMKSGTPRLTITNGSNTGATNWSCGRTASLSSTAGPAMTAMPTTATSMAAGTAQRGARRARSNQTSTMGTAIAGCSTAAATGARQIGKRMPASIALAMGLGMLVIARPSAGQRPASTMSTPQTMNAPTAAANCCVVAAAAT